MIPCRSFTGTAIDTRGLRDNLGHNNVHPLIRCSRLYVDCRVANLSCISAFSPAQHCRVPHPSRTLRRVGFTEAPFPIFCSFPFVGQSTPTRSPPCRSSPLRSAGCPILRVLCEGWDSLKPPFQYSVRFPSLGSPLRLDLHRAHLPRCIVQKAGPRPVFRPRHKTALDWIAVHVSQLFHALQLVVHVEVVVSPGAPGLDSETWDSTTLNPSSSV